MTKKDFQAFGKARYGEIYLPWMVVETGYSYAHLELIDKGKRDVSPKLEKQLQTLAKLPPPARTHPMLDEDHRIQIIAATIAG